MARHPLQAALLTRTSTGRRGVHSGDVTQRERQTRSRLCPAPRARSSPVTSRLPRPSPWASGRAGSSSAPRSAAEIHDVRTVASASTRARSSTNGRLRSSAYFRYCPEDPTRREAFLARSLDVKRSRLTPVRDDVDGLVQAAPRTSGSGRRSTRGVESRDALGPAPRPRPPGSIRRTWSRGMGVRRPGRAAPRRPTRTSMSPGQLLTETLVSSGTMTNRIDRLVSRRLVDRLPIRRPPRRPGSADPGRPGPGR